jgi:hypothetical protein
MNWTVTARFLDESFAIAVADFLDDHGVAFRETRAFGLREFRVECPERDALRLADALQLLGMRALFDGDGSCLLVVMPGGTQ